MSNLKQQIAQILYEEYESDCPNDPEGWQWPGYIRSADRIIAIFESDAKMIAALRRTLEQIVTAYENQNISHIEFRVNAQRAAASALRAIEQTAGESK